MGTASAVLSEMWHLSSRGPMPRFISLMAILLDGLTYKSMHAECNNARIRFDGDPFAALGRP